MAAGIKHSTRLHAFPAVVLLIAVLSRVVPCTSLPLVVVKLDDSNFEHATQASTGQTTGIWFILMSSGSNATHQGARQLWDDLANDEDRIVLYAAVDIDASNATALRFLELRGEKAIEDATAPLAVVLRNRKVYVYDGPLEGEDALAAVPLFATEGYQSATEHEVPPPRPSAAGGSKPGFDYITIGGTILSFVTFEIGRYFIDRDRQQRLARQAAAAAATEAEGQDEEPPAAATAGDSRPEDKKDQ